MDRLAIYWGLRHAGNSTEEIASRWELGSPGALFRLLRQDGFPICEVCGEYAKVGFCSEHKRKRTARGTGDIEELPPPANAANLFRPVTEELCRAVCGLDDYRIEQYRAGRFEKLDVYRDASVRVFRSLIEEENWFGLCEVFEEEPDQESIVISSGALSNAVGADASPQQTALIAAYFLIEGPHEQPTEQKLEALLDALHREPHKADRQKLLYGNLNSPEQHPGKVEELRRVARQVARLVRGVSIGGSPAEGLSGKQLNVAWQITNRLRSGTPYEEIKRELINRGLKESEVDFLKNVGIPPPH